MIKIFSRGYGKPAGAADSCDVVEYSIDGGSVTSEEIDALFIEAFKQRVGEIVDWLSDDDRQTAYENWIFSRQIEIEYLSNDAEEYYTTTLRTIKGPCGVACLLKVMNNPQFEAHIKGAEDTQKRYSELIESIELKITSTHIGMTDEEIAKSVFTPVCLNQCKVFDKVVILDMNSLTLHDGEVCCVDVECEQMVVDWNGWCTQFYINYDWTNTRYTFDGYVGVFLTMDDFKEWASSIASLVTK